ncbi:hypothetical protein ABFS83_08G079600 [Erythranthe nasuta]
MKKYPLLEICRGTSPILRGKEATQTTVINATIRTKKMSYRFGEAVFVPAGCPHQARNLKVSIRAQVCLSTLFQQKVSVSASACQRYIGRLPHNHSSKEDKLQVKGLFLSAVL